MTRALFAGSFNPFTIGHQAIVERTLKFVDEVIIGIGVNINKAETQDAAIPETRSSAISALYSDNPRVSVVEYEGLTVDFAKASNVDFLVRGVRDANDFQQEKELAQVNHMLSGLETVLLVADTNLEHISSSMVRELQKYGKDVSDLVYGTEGTKTVTE